ncbi:MAG: hypothetical protein LBR08_06650 [Bacteroidales bacterium]|nr:hypothetical protein [Bacteroidales bacterium]
MKKFVLYFFIAAGLTATADINAKIWRVNNNPGKSCDYTTLTAALQDAQPGDAGAVKTGDTIHIEGSVTEYGMDGQTATKCDTVKIKLVIIGPGYQLTDNSETQHNKESAKVRTLHIAHSAAGTVIAGLEQVAPTGGTNYYAAAKTGLQAGYYGMNATGVNTYGGWGDTPSCFKLRIEADSVVVSHCKLFYVDIYNATHALTNITITKCLFNPGLIAAAAGVEEVINLIISNNFFKNYWDWGVSYWPTIANSNAVIDLRGSTNYTYTTNSATIWEQWVFPVINPTIQNNTFYASFSIIAKGCQLYNNLFFPKQAGDYRNFGLWQYADRPHVTRNNIIFNGSYWGSPSAGGYYYNNNNYGGMLPGADGNMYSNITETSWFASSTTLPLNDKSFILGANSPAKDASGDDTKQRGMYGGLAPYVLSGLYTIPAVWEITIPNYPTGEVPSTGFEVRVRVKSH